MDNLKTRSNLLLEAFKTAKPELIVFSGILKRWVSIDKYEKLVAASKKYKSDRQTDKTRWNK